MKDIVLPWTCETQDKILIVLKWVASIGFPLLAIHFISYCDKIANEPAINNPIPFLEFVFGFFGSFIIWFAQIIFWIQDDRFPSIKCKCDVEQPKTEKVE